jgi:threonine dehydrogenase-like Zn-dependent dehydrogenase
MDVMEMMASKRWDIDKLITHEYPLEQLGNAIEKAADVDNALNVIIKF